MDLFAKFFKKPKAQTNFVGLPSLGVADVGRWYGHYCASKYDSAYPNIQAIVNEFITIKPKLIGPNGEPVQNHPVLDALYRPNKADSYISFIEKLVVSTLVNRATYILVWSRSGGVATKGADFGRRGENIAGFTFLESPTVSFRGKKLYYRVGSEEYSEDQVITILGGVDPASLYRGYSPTHAATQWITLDDYIADYQRGFFENNAIPAGVFVITARTQREFNDIVDTLQARHRGAGRNNNVSYAHRPIDPNTGAAQSAQIEWIPFSQSQKDIDFKAVFEQANKRIDMAYGVSQIIKGVDDQAKYSNADVSERGFAKRAVYPRALRIFSALTQELNRITGGLGVAISFDYEIPEVADRKKVEADVLSSHADTMLKMVAAGYELDSVVDAFKLPRNYKLLKLGANTGMVINNDKPQVDEGGEMEGLPDPRKEGQMAVRAELNDEKDELYDAAYDFLESRVNAAVEGGDENDESVVDRFVETALAAGVALLISSGSEQYISAAESVGKAGGEFNLTDTAKAEYEAHLRRVATSYDDETRESIAKVLERARVEGLNEEELRAALRDVMKTDEYRIARLARSEANRIDSLGKIEAMKQLEAETGVVIEKTLYHAAGPHCDVCSTMEGVWKPLNEPMIGLNEKVDLPDGSIWVNDYEENVGAPLHPNCGGKPKFRVVKND